MQPNTSLDDSLVLYHLSSDSVYYTIFVNSVVTSRFLLAKIRKEVHLEGVSQFRRSPEREIDVAGEDLGYVRTRDVHAAGELRLRDAKLLHAADDAAQERGTDMVNCVQGRI